MITQILKNKYYKFFLVIPLFYFLFMTLSGVQTLGINVDEGDVGVISFDFISQFTTDGHFVKRAEHTFLNGNSAVFATKAFGVLWPVMLHSYEGILSIYPSIFMLALDCNPALSLRLPHVLFAFFSLVLAYVILKKAFNPILALIAVLLFAVNPVFISSARIGHFADEILQIFLFMSVLYLLQKFVFCGRFRYLYFAFFICGIGVSAKFMFFGYLAGMFVVVLFLRKYRILILKKEIIFFGTLLFILGVLPVIMQNYASAFDPFLSFVENIFSKNKSGYDNLQVGSNLLVRCKDLVNFVLQKLHTFVYFEDKGYLNNYASLLLFALSIVFIAVSGSKIIRLFVAGYIVLFFLTVFVPFEYDQMHMVILFPIVEIMQAYFLYYVFRNYKKYKVMAIAIALCLMVMLSKAHMSNMEIRKRILTNQVGEEWSSLIYPFSEYIVDQKFTEIMTVKPLLSETPVSFLTGRKVKVINFWDHEKSNMDGLEKWYRHKIRNKDTDVYFALLDRVDVSDSHGHLLLGTLEKSGYTVSLIQDFRTDYDKIEIYRISKNRL